MGYNQLSRPGEVGVLFSLKTLTFVDLTNNPLASQNLLKQYRPGNPNLEYRNGVYMIEPKQKHIHRRAPSQQTETSTPALRMEEELREITQRNELLEKKITIIVEKWEEKKEKLRLFSAMKERLTQVAERYLDKSVRQKELGVEELVDLIESGLEEVSKVQEGGDNSLAEAMKKEFQIRSEREDVVQRELLSRVAQLEEENRRLSNLMNSRDTDRQESARRSHTSQTSSHQRPIQKFDEMRKIFAHFGGVNSSSSKDSLFKISNQ
eukprot:TRINITY_DN5107_c0_g1_i3.p1 TRINITY_DN5107_c0_g1~~TRINITY_DN5107_c0_g1_i3.p1  ORF type:complete len:265 (-),score=59.92 TRINITY_DN5107_c0_g1_i3:37-831(-)